MNDRTARVFRFQPLRYIRAWPRLSTSAVVAAGTVVLLALSGLLPAAALLLGFDLGALLYLGALVRMFCHARAEHLGRQARLQDTGRRATLVVVVIVSLVVLVALATELHEAKHGGLSSVAVAALSIVLSWLFMNVSFALHYAHGYYGDDNRLQGGLEFPGTPMPDYWDFVYFSFVVGMCFQTADVAISSRHMRHITLLHGVVAFFFNVFILALSVSVVGGLGG